MEDEGKGEGGGKGGWWGGGLAKEPASQCARVCQNYPSVNYSLVSPRVQEAFCFVFCFLAKKKQNTEFTKLSSVWTPRNVLASPSVTFVLSLFGVAPSIAVHGVPVHVRFSCGCEGKF